MNSNTHLNIHSDIPKLISTTFDTWKYQWQETCPRECTSMLYISEKSLKFERRQHRTATVELIAKPAATYPRKELPEPTRKAPSLYQVSSQRLPGKRSRSPDGKRPSEELLSQSTHSFLPAFSTTSLKYSNFLSHIQYIYCNKLNQTMMCTAIW